METSLTRSEPLAVLTPAPRIEELLDSFIASQDVRASSRYAYKRNIRQYFEWIRRTGLQLQDITRIEILRYKDELLASGMSSLTVGAYITTVRLFYEWAEASKLYPNVARGIRNPKRKQQFKKQALTEDQFRGLLVYLQDKALRDYAIINLLLRTGLRTIEAVRANVEDITFKGGKRILLIQGKGRDERDNFVILTDKAYKPIEDYLRTRGKVRGGEPIFISSSNNSLGERLTTRTISHIAKEGLKGIGLDGKEYTAHSLRHTTGTNLIRAGALLTDVQSVLRHADPATTQIYVNMGLMEKRIENAPEELLDRI